MILTWLRKNLYMTLICYVWKILRLVIMASTWARLWECNHNSGLDFWRALPVSTCLESVFAAAAYIIVQTPFFPSYLSDDDPLPFLNDVICKWLVIRILIVRFLFSKCDKLWFYFSNCLSAILYVRPYKMV